MKSSYREFANDIAKYFMDFLETNFHRRRGPKRSISSKNEKNLLTGINLKKYPNFKKGVLSLVNENFAKKELVIVKGKYTKHISPFIMEAVAKYSESLTEETFKEFQDLVSNSIKTIVKEYESDLESAKAQVLDIIKENIASFFVAPLIEMIQEPLNKKHSLEEDLLINIDDELLSLLVDKVEGVISNFIIDYFVSKNKCTLTLENAFDLQIIRNEIKNYFSVLTLNDLYFEFSELINNKEIIDKQELYLYISDIRYDKGIYPIFYIPIEAERLHDRINIRLDTSVYINKKAIEFIVQRVNEKKEQTGKIHSVSERIIYINEEDDCLKDRLENILNDIVSFIKSDGIYQLGKQHDQTFQGSSVVVTSNCHFAIFDKSDESLINDYEELISLLNNEESVLANKFISLLSSFLKDDPVKVTRNVEKEWDETEICEKLVHSSPIPLNEEQRQILRAINEKECRFVTVEGPPGTGKSHTITAIAFYSILEDKSILVLSDKKEALDVVDDKITKVLKSVRVSEESQNPILRLGKSGSTYNKILSTTSITNIKNHFKVVDRHKDIMRQQISNVERQLKKNINTEISEYEKIKLQDISEIENLEHYLNTNSLMIFDESELFLGDGVFADDLESLRNISVNFKSMFSDEGPDTLRVIYQPLYRGPGGEETFHHFRELVSLITDIKESGLDYSNMGIVEAFQKKDLPNLISIVTRTEDLGKGLFGYMFKGRALRSLTNELHQSFKCPEIVNIKSHLGNLKNIVDVFKMALRETDSNPAFKKDVLTDDVFITVYKLLKSNYEIDVSLVNEIVDNFVEINYFISDYPLTSNKLKLQKPSEILTSLINKLNSDDFSKLIDYLRLRKKTEESFSNIPEYNFVRSAKTLEDLYATKMAHLLDGRVIAFSEKSATANTLKTIIRSKKRFPKEEFKYLKEAFPCIIAGIRDYAEYIPLEDAMFDLVIIDEASQVSIAQALPAILRAKKVVVFGDKKQFSNIKSAQARSEVNRQYLSEIKANYNLNHDPTSSELVRLLKFDIKTSILDFFEYVGNYNIMLRKHFRGYRELISYSSEYFYQNHLQSIKIRGKKIDEVLRFVNVKHDGEKELVDNTNIPEIEAILSYLESVVSEQDPPSIGIITPHTNQHKMLISYATKHEKYEDFAKRLKLKIMTFDTCQGEERDIILYSMVANHTSDKLNYVFIKDLSSIDIDEESKIKAQRLNVGFSRAKEAMIFFVSKPISDFSGSIRDALVHYQKTLEKCKSLPLAENTDRNSPMEKKVLEWIQETSFFKENSNSIELKAQFEIGEYLKQLDSTYSHPNYVCDFLLLFTDKNKEIHKIVIEYDGFEEHFVNRENVNMFNYQQYYSEDDVFREKVLEGYGYKFLRINRFNSGRNPIVTLGQRLNSLVKPTADITGQSFIKNIHSIVSELNEGNSKECLRCGKFFPISDFEDSSLASGIGRTCMQCKKSKPKRRRERQVSTSSKKKEKNIEFSHSEAKTEENCPSCGSTMILRSGKYGRFLGCSKYPQCVGTRNYKQNAETISRQKQTSNRNDVSEMKYSPFNQTEVYWNQRYLDCKDFYINHGKYPSGKSLNKEERALYNWAKQQRKRSEKGTLNKEQQEKMVQVDFFLQTKM